MRHSCRLSDNMTPRQLLTLPIAFLALAAAGYVDGIRSRLESEGSRLPLLASVFPAVSVPAQMELPTLLVAATPLVEPEPIPAEPAPAPGSLRLNKPLLPKALAEDAYQPLVGGRSELTAIRPVRVPTGLRRTALSEPRLITAFKTVDPDSIIRSLSGS